MSWAATKVALATDRYNWDAVKHLAGVLVATLVAIWTSLMTSAPEILATYPSWIGDNLHKFGPYAALLAVMYKAFKAAQSLPPVVPPSE